jgi:hypothetical protein
MQRVLQRVVAQTRLRRGQGHRSKLILIGLLVCLLHFSMGIVAACGSTTPVDVTVTDDEGNPIEGEMSRLSIRERKRQSVKPLLTATAQFHSPAITVQSKSLSVTRPKESMSRLKQASTRLTHPDSRNHSLSRFPLYCTLSTPTERLDSASCGR